MREVLPWKPDIVSGFTTRRIAAGQRREIFARKVPRAMWVRRTSRMEAFGGDVSPNNRDGPLRPKAQPNADHRDEKAVDSNSEVQHLFDVEFPL